MIDHLMIIMLVGDFTLPRYITISASDCSECVPMYDTLKLRTYHTISHTVISKILIMYLLYILNSFPCAWRKFLVHFLLLLHSFTRIWSFPRMFWMGTRAGDLFNTTLLGHTSFGFILTQRWMIKIFMIYINVVPLGYFSLSKIWMFVSVRHFWLTF